MRNAHCSKIYHLILLPHARVRIESRSCGNRDPRLTKETHMDTCRRPLKILFENIVEMSYWSTECYVFLVSGASPHACMPPCDLWRAIVAQPAAWRNWGNKIQLATPAYQCHFPSWTWNKRLSLYPSLSTRCAIFIRSLSPRFGCLFR